MKVCFSPKAAFALAQKYNVEMPIVKTVNQILFDKDFSASKSTGMLMERSAKVENLDMPW